jgi:rubrerythrin
VLPYQVGRGGDMPLFTPPPKKMAKINQEIISIWERDDLIILKKFPHYKRCPNCGSVWNTKENKDCPLCQFPKYKKRKKF